jgi:hypothetical protein
MKKMKKMSVRGVHLLLVSKGATVNDFNPSLIDI